MIDETKRVPEGDMQALGESLGPALRETCGGTLGEISWFRASWQRGGAATGSAVWTLPDREVDVVVKLPIGPRERQWCASVGASETWADGDDTVIPRTLASGSEVGGYDLAWVVMEKLPGHPLSSSLDKDALRDMLVACARFQARCATIRPVDEAPPRKDWEHLIEVGRDHLPDTDIAEPQRWNVVLKKVQKLLPTLQTEWRAREVNTWCHGDLHGGNAMRRGEHCVLIDLALVHAGHWIEDAIYLERQFWGHKDRLQGIKPLSVLARARRDLGLDNGEDYARAATIRRVLMAACVPALFGREGHHAYANAALELIEANLGQL
ncbi:MAG: aminoglycoside phosphotransferase family protein [Phycisphaerales bacterium]|nr:aminoglycoside phosphotransferase family protein [Phycisphaerales bacterium]